MTLNDMECSTRFFFRLSIYFMKLLYHLSLIPKIISLSQDELGKEDGRIKRQQTHSFKSFFIIKCFCAKCFLWIRHNNNNNVPSLLRLLSAFNAAYTFVPN